MGCLPPSHQQPHLPGSHAPAESSHAASRQGSGEGHHEPAPERTGRQARAVPQTSRGKAGGTGTSSALAGTGNPVANPPARSGQALCKRTVTTYGRKQFRAATKIYTEKKEQFSYSLCAGGTERKRNRVFLKQAGKPAAANRRGSLPTRSERRSHSSAPGQLRCCSLLKTWREIQRA